MKQCAMGVQRERERDWIRLSSIDVSVSCYLANWFNGETLYHIGNTE